MTQEVKTILTIGIVTMITLVGGVLFLSKGGTSQSQTPIKVDTNFLVRENSHKIASDSAKVTVVEFSDFQCPACQAAQPLVKQVLKDYQGRINFVYRHFPLPQHKFASKAAMASEAAEEQGKFWEFHDKLFDNQEAWSEVSDPMTNFVAYAQELGLDIEKFKQAVEGNKFADRVQQDINDGNAVGVNSTPTFYINGEKLIVKTGYQDFKNKIDSEIQK